MASPYLGQIQITHSKLLIVEGEDEKRFFSSLISGIGITDIQILPIGGKTRLSAHLKALRVSPDFDTKVDVLAITRDADEDASAAFKSVCSALKSADLPTPKKVLERKGNHPAVIVMIIPPTRDSGKLEDMCLESVSPEPAMPCVESYLKCLEHQGCSLPSDLSKARVHIFLASRQRPGLRLGEAAEAGYWPFKNSPFDQVEQFLSSL